MTVDNDVSQDKRRFSRTLGLGLAGIAVISSLLASTCCVIPLILVLLGITGAWMVNLTALEPWTPVFSALAVTALAGSGYLVFRPVAECVSPEGACGLPRRDLMLRLYLVAVIIVLGLLLFPLVAPIFYG